MRKRELFLILGLTTLGLALRIVFMLAMKSGWPGWDSPTIDALYHHLWAKKIAMGDILGSSPGYDAGPFFRAPFYPYILGLVYSIFGTDFLATRILQHLFGVLAVPLTFMVARQYFHVVVAYLAALLVAINGVLIYFESQLLLDFLTVVLYLIFLYLLIKAHREKSSWLYLITGFIAGIFAITRPNILAVVFFVIIWIFLAEKHLKTKIKHSILLLIGTCIIILPVTLRNIFIGDDIVLIASQGGINFYIGNNDKADGYTALLPGTGHSWQYSDAEYEVAGNLGQKPGTIKPSKVSSYYYRKALRFIVSSPDKFLKLLIKKIYLFWNYFEISNNNNLYYLTRYIGVPGYLLSIFAIIGPAGLVGAVLCFKKDKHYWILPITIFGYMATVIAFFVTSRFRIPVVPILSITAVYAFYEVITALTEKRLKYALIISISILVVCLFSWSNLYKHHDKSMAMAEYSLGNTFLKKGDYKSARLQYQKALQQAYNLPKAHLNLGVIAFYEGDTALARIEFQNEIKICGPSAKAFNNLSLLKRLKGDFQSAYALADSAVHYFPNNKEAYINRISASFGKNDETMIKSATESFIKTFPFEPSARYYHGLFLIRSGAVELAKNEFRFAINKKMDIISEYDLSEIYSADLPYGYQPEKIRGKSSYQLGLIYAQENDIDSAFHFFRQAIKYIPNDPDARANLALAYDKIGNYQMAEFEFLKAISIDSTRALYFYNYALTLGKMRRYSKAKEMLAKACLLKPDFTQAKQKLKALKQYLDNSPDYK
ncbi:MAG: hypothetical protein DRP26_05920 [Candidatus Zixiibacteriota bacterium]|nr:MAG: hypothetical protein DRP26_05920 [candidate division Zixibacteria bacterium]